jgi:hypothetical protein
VELAVSFTHRRRYALVALVGMKQWVVAMAFRMNLMNRSAGHLVGVVKIR